MCLTVGDLWSEARKRCDGSGTRGQEEQEAHRLRQRSPSRGNAADVRHEERPQDDKGEQLAQTVAGGVLLTCACLQAEDELKKAQQVFDELNGSLQNELPTLWDR